MYIYQRHGMGDPHLMKAIFSEHSFRRWYAEPPCFNILIIKSGLRILIPANTWSPLLKKASGIILAVGPMIAVRLPLLIKERMGSMV